jgi:DNA topoisomerase-1
MRAGEALDLHKLTPEQHFTQPPPRYTEASLIKELEEQGIGRPSTYVPIISTIQDRGYVDQEQRRFVTTWLGETVNEVMNKHFPDIVDSGFTAEMERKLDDVEDGRRSWIDFLSTFYGDFKDTMKKAEADMKRVQKPVEEMDELCPKCGLHNLVLRNGRFGSFISCSGFPECDYKRSVVNKTGALCPKCGGDLVEKKMKMKKRVFYGCNNWPTCDFAIWEKPLPEPCPNCGGLLVQQRPGQDPVCWNEVLGPQRERAAGTEPNADGSAAKKTRTYARKTAASDTADSAVTKTRTTARKTTGTRVKSGSGTPAAKKTTTVRAKAGTRTTTRKTTSTRAKASTSAAAKKPTTRARPATSKTTSPGDD